MGHTQPDIHLPKTPVVKVYVFLAVQTGTNPPLIREMINTTGAIITWTRVDAGTYDGTADIGIFTQFKCACYGSTKTHQAPWFQRMADDRIRIYTFNNLNALADSQLSLDAFRVEIYN